MIVPVLVFADYTQPFLLEIDASKDGLGWCCHRSKQMGGTTPWPYGSRSLLPHEKNYQSTNFEFLALKWAVTEHFKEKPTLPIICGVDG